MGAAHERGGSATRFRTACYPRSSPLAIDNKVYGWVLVGEYRLVAGLPPGDIFGYQRPLHYYLAAAVGVGAVCPDAAFSASICVFAVWPSCESGEMSTTFCHSAIALSMSGVGEFR